VDWRPETYFKPGTRVTLDAELNGTDSGNGGWFVRDYTSTFTIGAEQIVEVDLDSHRLTLVRDGRTVRRIPVSGGTPGGDKRSWRGTAVLMAKEGTINMNSETVGLGDAYDKMVDYSMRLTWSGMYAHAAPWNAPYFGNANRSSGCIGMSDADAAWFYDQVRWGGGGSAQSWGWFPSDGRRGRGAVGHVGQATRPSIELAAEVSELPHERLGPGVVVGVLAPAAILWSRLSPWSRQ
jgi:hypothetical protein